MKVQNTTYRTNFREWESEPQYETGTLAFTRHSHTSAEIRMGSTNEDCGYAYRYFITGTPEELDAIESLSRGVQALNLDVAPATEEGE